jgi:hypothetical protein
VLSRLQVAWEQVPQLRLGQLLMNAVQWRSGHNQPLFYTEDYVLADLVDAWVREVGSTLPS